MVLIFGHADDRCASLTDQLLRQRGIDVICINVSDLLSTVALSWSLDRRLDQSFHLLNSRRFPLSELSGVLARSRPAVPTDAATPQDQRYIAAELDAALQGLLYSLPCRVVNRPAVGLARRPLVQSLEQRRQVIEAGFRLPAMVMTSRHEDALRFYARCGRRVLLSTPTSHGPRRLLRGADGESELKALLAEHPVCLHEVPDGEWLQVFTIGERAFATAAPVDGLAKRGDALSRDVELSPVVQAQCRRLAQAYELEFAQLDLVRSERDACYCLWISAWPQITGCGEALQHRIAGALADLLREEAGKSSDDLALWGSGRTGDRVSLLAVGQPES
jgi:hypothetical protein